MKHLFLFAIGTILIVSCNKPAKDSTVMSHTETCDSVKDGVFIHITESYNDPHRVLMPLKMATMMAKDKDVLIYFDIHAPEMLVKSAKDMTFADFESLQTYLNQLSELGVGLYACPTCLKIQGYKPEDLAAGIQVAQKDKFFDFTKGRIITLDY